MEQLGETLAILRSSMVEVDGDENSEKLNETAGEAGWLSSLCLRKDLLMLVVLAGCFLAALICAVALLAVVLAISIYVTDALFYAVCRRLARNSKFEKRNAVTQAMLLFPTVDVANHDDETAVEKPVSRDGELKPLLEEAQQPKKLKWLADEDVRKNNVKASAIDEVPKFPEPRRPDLKCPESKRPEPKPPKCAMGLFWGLRKRLRLMRAD